MGPKRGPMRELYHARTVRTRSVLSAAPHEAIVVAAGTGVLRSRAMRFLLPVFGMACWTLWCGLAGAADAPEQRYRSDEALRHYVAGRWLEETGDMPGAGAELARAMALDPDNAAIQLEACLVASRAGEPSHALELARGVLAKSPRNARALWLMGAALVSLERPEEAVAPLRYSTLADGGNAECWRTLARAAEATQRIALVDSCYARLVELDADDAESWFQLATARARLGRYAEADSALSEAIEDNPTRPGVLFLRAWLRERLGQPGEAIALYQHHLEIHPDDVATRRRLVGLLSHEGRVHEALAEARRVTAAAAGDASAYQAQADLEFRDKRPDDALKTLQRMRALAPDDPDGVGRSAEVLVRWHRPADAIAITDQ